MNEVCNILSGGSSVGSISIAGDMPRNQSVGYIFMQGNTSLSDARLVAHELGHGVYRLQHTFDYKHAEEDKYKTDNLMDYNGGSFLAHYQWRIMQDSVMFVWKSLQDDEDGMWTTIISFGASVSCLFSFGAEGGIVIDDNGGVFLLGGFSVGSETNASVTAGALELTVYPNMDDAGYLNGFGQQFTLETGEVVNLGISSVISGRYEGFSVSVSLGVGFFPASLSGYCTYSRIVPLNGAAKKIALIKTLSAMKQ